MWTDELIARLAGFIEDDDFIVEVNDEVVGELAWDDNEETVLGFVFQEDLMVAYCDDGDHYQLFPDWEPAEFKVFRKTPVDWLS